MLIELQGYFVGGFVYFVEGEGRAFRGSHHFLLVFPKLQKLDLIIMRVLKGGDDGLLVEVKDGNLALVPAEHGVEPAAGFQEEYRVQPELKAEVLSLLVDIAQEVFAVGVGDADEVVGAEQEQGGALADADLHPFQEHLRLCVVDMRLILHVQHHTVAL